MGIFRPSIAISSDSKIRVFAGEGDLARFYPILRASVDVKTKAVRHGMSALCKSNRQEVHTWFCFRGKGTLFHPW